MYALRRAGAEHGVPTVIGREFACPPRVKAEAWECPNQKIVNQGMKTGPISTHRALAT
jgi:hypothetical protein